MLYKVDEFEVYGHSHNISHDQFTSTLVWLGISIYFTYLGDQH